MSSGSAREGHSRVETNLGKRKRSKPWPVAVPAGTNVAHGKAMLSQKASIDSPRMEKLAWLPFLDTVSLVRFSQTSTEHKLTCSQSRFWTKAETMKKHGRKPLIGAIKFGTEEEAHALLDVDKEFVNGTDKIGRTALVWAAYYGKLSIFSRLIEREGQDLMGQDIEGNTAVHWIATYGFTNLAKYLGSNDCYSLKFHECLHLRNDDGETPFLRACSHGHLAMVEYFYQVAKGIPGESHGPFLNATNSNGDTPLMRAAQHDHYAVCKYLLENGASPSTKSKTNRTPLMWAQIKSYGRIVDLFLRYLAQGRPALGRARQPAQHNVNEDEPEVGNGEQPPNPQPLLLGLRRRNFRRQTQHHQQ